MHSQLQLPLWLTRKLAEKELVKLKGKPQAYSGSMLEDIEADAANAKVKRRGGLYFYDVGLKIRDIREKACVGAGRPAGGGGAAGRRTDGRGAGGISSTARTFGRCWSRRSRSGIRRSSPGRTSSRRSGG